MKAERREAFSLFWWAGRQACPCPGGLASRLVHALVGWQAAWQANLCPGGLTGWLFSVLVGWLAGLPMPGFPCCLQPPPPSLWQCCTTLFGRQGRAGHSSGNCMCGSESGYLGVQALGPKPPLQF